MHAAEHKRSVDRQQISSFNRQTRAPHTDLLNKRFSSNLMEVWCGTEGADCIVEWRSCHFRNQEGQSNGHLQANACCDNHNKPRNTVLGVTSVRTAQENADLHTTYPNDQSTMWTSRRCNTLHTSSNIPADCASNMSTSRQCSVRQSQHAHDSALSRHCAHIADIGPFMMSSTLAFICWCSVQCQTRVCSYVWLWTVVGGHAAAAWAK